ncbi:response regulator transcription factor [Marinisporobacter balticus]|uniref:Stage 0 sporulation protein A homolog n=1 Tax=Marinisporobacter balticus TaxID=2018667 RepID=A0A4R2L5I1_9FIRM|nr:response regulator transcription factor [Marinisporobacter balticus]TCO79289.1 two-component system alkaline phosphatase synthesis response regulator PhoP [Marinisporobacter balticus]
MGRKKILVVDDEQHIIELIQFNLENNGFDVITSENGEDAIKIAEEEIPDVILLDLMLPGIDGLEACKKIRNIEKISKIPIIMLTAKGEEMDKVLGLELGADDYLTKPFSVRELIARIKAILRRSEEIPKEVIKTIKVNDITIDIEKHEVIKDDEKIELTLKEFELLKILAQNRGKVLSRNLLLDEVWGYDYFGETRTVDVHIRHLRKKIEDNDKYPIYIETIRGIGYKMK